MQIAHQNSKNIFDYNPDRSNFKFHLDIGIAGSNTLSTFISACDAGILLEEELLSLQIGKDSFLDHLLSSKTLKAGCYASVLGCGLIGIKNFIDYKTEKLNLKQALTNFTLESGITLCTNVLTLSLLSYINSNCLRALSLRILILYGSFSIYPALSYVKSYFIPCT